MINTGKKITTDFLIIGSGCAGLTAALKAAELGKSVLVVSKRKFTDCATIWAQGGISCVVRDEDSFESHVEDTLKAGAGLCDIEAVKAIVKEGPKRVKDLVDWGVRFSSRGEIDMTITEEEAKEYDLGKEGGHSHRRVLHSGDITGRELVQVLLQQCQDHPAITLWEASIAVDLIVSKRLELEGHNRCFGAYILNSAEETVYTITASYTVLATGGAGKAYLYTTNPDIATGDGIAMGYRAYAVVSNMEFYQFHPTCLYHPKGKNFLISEAVRGEGAELKVLDNGKMTAFMQKYHELGSLAPRDIVARAIDQELKRTGQKSVFLDITHHSEAFIKRRFPNIFAKCLECGINMAEDLIPVVPAAHYCCGGIDTDVNGYTGISGLYAIGETACTGLHGANRLASNSLLEAVVTGSNCITHCIEKAQPFSTSGIDIPDWNSGKAIDADEQIVITHNWQEIRQFMWDYVGIYRTDKRLQRAKRRVELLRREIEQYYWNFTITPDLIELRNLVSVAEMIIDSALKRDESRGLHYNADKRVNTDPVDAVSSKIIRKYYPKSQ